MIQPHIYMDVVTSSVERGSTVLAHGVPAAVVHTQQVS